MLFKPVHVPMILSGRKTETRRGWKRPMVKVGGLYQAQTALYKPDTVFAHLRVLHMWKEQLYYITDRSIYNEGYDTRSAYYEVYREINRIPLSRWDPSQVVTAIRFRLEDKNG